MSKFKHRQEKNGTIDHNDAEAFLKIVDIEQKGFIDINK